MKNKRKRKLYKTQEPYISAAWCKDQRNSEINLKNKQ